jgi:hypothetical protein
MKKIDDDAMKAVAANTGPVTRCPPGRACAPEPVGKPGEAARWLHEHRGDLPVIDPKAERRRRRMERAQRERIAARNAAILRRR